MLTFALDVAMQMFRQGAETDGIVTTVRRLAAAYEVDDLRLSVAARTIHVQHRPPGGDESIVLLGVIDADDSRDRCAGGGPLTPPSNGGPVREPMAVGLQPFVASGGG
ncbi:hypothetical protein [Aeromicrobium piscarium]|uniref:Uncharacterized protein n=1 Tax=Aeromicrobium piscarium TaxID=2590901 RepID=A0A554S8X8_9ACTN|nr:hypothetical protein [Aeromicrobium piscarium]TSD62797.1 hypothetical protein FNM00_10515 [Aeromicrobium piscarium]